MIRWLCPCARDALETVGFVLGQQELASMRGTSSLTRCVATERKAPQPPAGPE
jgi:hypothetical protein